MKQQYTLDSKAQLRKKLKNELRALSQSIKHAKSDDERKSIQRQIDEKENLLDQNSEKLDKGAKELKKITKELKKLRENLKKVNVYSEEWQRIGGEIDLKEKLYISQLNAAEGRNEEDEVDERVEYYNARREGNLTDPKVADAYSKMGKGVLGNNNSKYIKPLTMPEFYNQYYRTTGDDLAKKIAYLKAIVMVHEDDMNRELSEAERSILPFFKEQRIKNAEKKRDLVKDLSQLILNSNFTSAYKFYSEHEKEFYHNQSTIDAKSSVLGMIGYIFSEIATFLSRVTHSNMSRGLVISAAMEEYNTLVNRPAGKK